MARAVWGFLQNELEKITMERLKDKSPYASLIIAVILQAAQDRDVEYLEGPEFWGHCKLVSIDPDTTYLLFKNVWHSIDTGTKLKLKDINISDDEYSRDAD